MTSVLGTHKAAEEFAAALEGRLPTSRLRPGLAELVDVAQELRAVGPPPQRTGFHDQLRERLMTEAVVPAATREGAGAVTRPRAPAAPVTSWRKRLGALLVAVVLGTGAVAATAAAARQALPGDRLYGVKRAVETAHTVVTPGGPGEEHLELAAVRLHEVGVLLERSADPGLASGTLSAFREEVGLAAEEVEAAHRADGGTAGLEALTASTAEGLATLRDYAASAEPSSRDRIEEVAAALARIDERARGLCGATCRGDGAGRESS